MIMGLKLSAMAGATGWFKFWNGKNRFVRNKVIDCTTTKLKKFKAQIESSENTLIATYSYVLSYTRPTV